MSTKIIIRPNGPILVDGDVTLTNAAGEPITVEKRPFSLCRCGHSKSKPFCDGAHKHCGFEAS